MTEALASMPPLRLMIYDKTDVRQTFKLLRSSTPDELKKIGERFGFDFDDIDFEIPIGLSHSWFAGGRLYKTLRWIDECRGFDSWDEALHWINNYGHPRKVSQIQIWGHGSPGKSWIKGEPLTKNSFFGDHSQALSEIKGRLTDDAVIWFRNCSVFCGNAGREFAKAWAREMNCRIAAHTYIIGPFQSGLHTLGPGEEPMWPETEGIVEGTPDRVISCRWSVPWAPNTVFMLKSRIPKNW